MGSDAAGGGGLEAVEGCTDARNLLFWTNCGISHKNSLTLQHQLCLLSPKAKAGVKRLSMEMCNYEFRKSDRGSLRRP